MEYKPLAPIMTPEVSRGVVRERTLTMEVTAYTHTGKQTASGTWPKHGTIAADKNLPFGTRIYIPTYNFYGIVTDRGSLIKGNKLDIFMDSRTDCINFGRKTLEVKILE